MLSDALNPLSTSVPRYRTALRRPDLSRPIRLAIEDSLINGRTTVLDYGCGQGDDVRQLEQRQVQCIGWDPFYSPATERSHCDVVNLGYVVNVIENTVERAGVLRDAWSYARRVLIVAARLTAEGYRETDYQYEDGYLTRRGTFQKLFEQHELKDWIESTIGESPVAAAPGVFYVFRDPELKYAYVSARVRRTRGSPTIRRSDSLFEAHKQLFEELIAFVSNRGRLPSEEELPSTALLRQEIGSIRKAFAIVRRVTGAAQWASIRAEREQDLLVYLALARFTKRPRFSVLPISLKLDLRAFFSNYSHACELADQLLFSVGHADVVEKACRSARVGKETPTSLYVHKSALSSLEPLLRVYEGCATALVGTIEKANVVKLHFSEPMISYLSYPRFEMDAHPALASSLSVDLRSFKIRFRQYTDSPPILHRKEEFVRDDDPMRVKYERLTRSEEMKGLFEQPSEIGTRDGWLRILATKGLRVAGHRLVRMT